MPLIGCSKCFKRLYPSDTYEGFCPHCGTTIEESATRRTINHSNARKRIEEIESEVVSEIVKKNGIGARNWLIPEPEDRVEAIIRYLEELN